nr:CD1375 family protein [uncultured Lachnoanaerobaculum sp.]
MSKKKIKVYIRFYASRIKYGLMTLDEVPAKYKEAVEEFMKTDEFLMM